MERDQCSGEQSAVHWGTAGIVCVPSTSVITSGLGFTTYDDTIFRLLTILLEERCATVKTLRSISLATVSTCTNVLHIE